MSGPVLEVQDLHVRFPATEPVRGVSLALHPGQTHCVVGESGSGKSLTALSIMGPPATGWDSFRTSSLAGCGNG